MILHLYSDASYLSEKETKSRAGGSFTWAETSTMTKTYQQGNFDHSQSSQTRNAFGSGSKNWSSFFRNAKEGAFLRTILEELGHPQPPPHQWRQTIPPP
jgi:hypothetical protein